MICNQSAQGTAPGIFPLLRVRNNRHAARGATREVFLPHRPQGDATPSKEAVGDGAIACGCRPRGWIGGRRAHDTAVLPCLTAHLGAPGVLPSATTRTGNAAIACESSARSINACNPVDLPAWARACATAVTVGALRWHIPIPAPMLMATPRVTPARTQAMGCH